MAGFTKRREGPRLRRGLRGDARQPRGRSRRIVRRRASRPRAARGRARRRGVDGAEAYRAAPSLAAAALSIGALRSRLAMAPVADRGEQDPAAFDFNGASTMDLAGALRAAGAALITGAAFGDGAAGGLAPSELNDVSAWLRRLARRFAPPGRASPDENALALLSPDENSLGASNELIALADACDALAGHPVSVLDGLVQAGSGGGGRRAAIASGLRALSFRAAAAAARVRSHYAATAPSAGSVQNSGSLLRLATWRRANPGERGRGDRVHPVVDALAQALSSAENLERSVACALCAALAQRAPAADAEDADWDAVAKAVKAAREAQDWRLRLESFACATPASKLRHGPDGTPPDAAAVERLAVAYSLLREAVGDSAAATAAASAGNLVVPVALAPNASAETPARAWEAWQHASGRVNVALGIPPGDGAVPPALLWRLGGHPLVPRTEGLRRAEDRVRFLCAALRPGRSDVVVAAAAAAAREAGRGDDDAARVASAAMERATLAAAAAVGGNGGGAGLRSAALEGLCFFAWTHVGGGVRGGADEDGADAAAFLESEAATIPAQIADECSKLAAAAAAAAAPTPTLGKGEEVGGDDDDAMAIDTFVERTDALEPPAPREYDLNSFELLRSADVFEGFDGAGGQRPPAPLGFPVWSQRFAKCRVAHGSLLPLLELHSIASQMTLLEVVSTRLARVSLASTVESTPQTKEATRARLTADELAAAARGLSFGVAAAPRDPADFVAHRHLLWLARADGGDDRLAESIPSLAHAMWRSWHASGWGGVLDEIPAALQPKLRVKRSETDGFSAKDFDRGSTHAAASWNAARGPVRGERATSTFLAIALVATHGGMDGVASRPARALQLRLAARALRLTPEGGSHARRSRRPGVVRPGFAHRAGARGARHRRARAREARARRRPRRPRLLDVPAEAPGWWFRAEPKSRRRRAPPRQTLPRGVRRRSRAAEEAHGTRRGSARRRGHRGSARARELAESTAVRAFASVESSATWAKRRRVDCAARGAAWALLGLLRLHLLLPDGGLPDPAAATRARLDRADAVLSRETAPTLACLAWQTRVAAATPPPESAVAAATSEARSLAAESARLARNVVPRPDPPLWTPMLAEAARFRDQLASVERVTGIVAALSADQRAGDDVAAKARAEAVAWLDAAGPWGDRLDVSFPGYRDATEPLQLAALELRRGLALLVSAAPDVSSDGAKAEAARGKITPGFADAAAAAAAAHLLAFPPLASVGGGSAAALLASPATQRALSVVESVAWTRDAAARRTSEGLAAGGLGAMRKRRQLGRQRSYASRRCEPRWRLPRRRRPRPVPCP